MAKKSSVFIAAVCGALLVWSFGWGFSQRRALIAKSFDDRRLALLETENERLRGVIASQDKAKALGENNAGRGQIERAVAELRGMSFLHPVTYDVLTRAGIRQIVDEKLNEQFSEEEFKNIGLGLSALGLLPRDYPLKQKYIELLGEQIAAFYDQHQHKLFMFEDASLSNAQNRIILAHELTHALQDQHFDLLKMPIELKNNDDRALAASALIEGDATLVMSQYMLQDLSLGGLTQNLSGALSQNMKQLQDAPRYLREMLIFPYLRGQEFCTALLEGGGRAALDAAFKNPPSSTSQVLHPEKFLTEPGEEPVEIDFGDTTLNGEKPLADNVLGEAGIRILLSEFNDPKKSEDIASGWRGDRYLVFKNGDALIWKTAWRDFKSAAAFCEALRPGLEKRYGVKIEPLGSNQSGNSVRDSSRVLRVSLDPATNQVVLLDAKDEQSLLFLVEFLKSRVSSPGSE
ncbi:MAG: hypothetical protein QOD99_257 [Chthoniobacter sp.]|nr:hypothetical protein [Chthoniobacter sp.]